MKKILVCPLDWGLGHATRSIPVVRELLKKGAEVSIGSSGSALQLLKQEFLDLPFFDLPSYSPVYQSTGFLMMKMIAQLPKFGKVIEAEHAMTEKIVSEKKIDIVISDNRFGCWSSRAKSIFITHQGNVVMPEGFHWMAPVINYFNHHHIKKYTEIWIPDQPGSGLTEPFICKCFTNQKYIGWLSRFQRKDKVKQSNEVIAIVSGPDPQRTMFKNILTTQLKASGLKSLLVAGEPGEHYRRQEGCLEIVNHLTATELEAAILSSNIVISRSGYSTVMDLIALGAKALFIPTPQQPEQIYFAEYFKEKHIAFTMDQNNFSLSVAIENSKDYDGFSSFSMDGDYLVNAIDKLVSS